MSISDINSAASFLSKYGGYGDENPMNALIRKYGNSVNDKYLLGLANQINHGANPNDLYYEAQKQLTANRKKTGASGVGAITPVLAFLRGVSNNSGKVQKSSPSLDDVINFLNSTR